MRSLLFVIALICTFITICLCTIMGVRLGPTLGRAVIVFIAVYGIGLIAALFAFVSLLSTGSRDVLSQHPTSDTVSDEHIVETEPVEE